MTTQDAILDTLRRHRAEFEAMGVRHLSLFGSQARGDARPDSDIDIGVAFDPAEHEKGFAYFGTRHDVENALNRILNTSVDLSDETMMRDRVKRRYLRDRLVAF